MAIDQDYASPNMRWALLVHDCPGATFEITEGVASEFGVPDAWGGSQPVVICTITFPPETGREPVVAYKELVDEKNKPITDGNKNPGTWNTLSTKALGRAAQRAGYPANKEELRVLMEWRRRTMLNAALAAQTAATPALPAGEQDKAAEVDLQKAITAAGTADPEAADHTADDEPVDAELVAEDGAAVDASTGEVQRPAPAPAAPPPVADEEPVDAVLVDDGTAPSKDLLVQLREAVNASAATGKQTELRAWARSQGIDNFASPDTAEQAQAIIDHAATLAPAS